MNKRDCLICPSNVQTPLIDQNKKKKVKCLRKTAPEKENVFWENSSAKFISLCVNCSLLPSKETVIFICPSTSYLQTLVSLRWGARSGHLPLASCKSRCCVSLSYFYITTINLHIYLNCIFHKSTQVWTKDIKEWRIHPFPPHFIPALIWDQCLQHIILL